jgi:hypothetical protein
MPALQGSDRTRGPSFTGYRHPREMQARCLRDKQAGSLRYKQAGCLRELQAGCLRYNARANCRLEACANCRQDACATNLRYRIYRARSRSRSSGASVPRIDSAVTT